MCFVRWEFSSRLTKEIFFEMKDFLVSQGNSRGEEEISSRVRINENYFDGKFSLIWIWSELHEAQKSNVNSKG